MNKSKTYNTGMSTYLTVGTSDFGSGYYKIYFGVGADLKRVFDERAWVVTNEEIDNLIEVLQHIKMVGAN